jgi:anti-sigma B factor antagonist
MDALLTQLEEGPPPVLRVAGELDMATADGLRGALEEAVAADPSVVVDLAGVTFVDVMGLRAILEVADSLNGRGPLALVNAPQVARLLRWVGLDGITSIALHDGA